MGQFKLDANNVIYVGKWVGKETLAQYFRTEKEAQEYALKIAEKFHDVHDEVVAHYNKHIEECDSTEINKPNPNSDYNRFLSPIAYANKVLRERKIAKVKYIKAFNKYKKFYVDIDDLYVVKAESLVHFRTNVITNPKFQLVPKFYNKDKKNYCCNCGFHLPGVKYLFMGDRKLCPMCIKMYAEKAQTEINANPDLFEEYKSELFIRNL